MKVQTPQLFLHKVAFFTKLLKSKKKKKKGQKDHLDLKICSKRAHVGLHGLFSKPDTTSRLCCPPALCTTNQRSSAANHRIILLN